MSETSKVLDVTYGTFSCRLEGFEDSVETMKTVVSFFHELAGHNRFMDMTPQAPDLDTLEELTSDQAGAPVSAEVDDVTQRVSLRVRRPEAPAAEEQDDRPSLRLPRPAASAASLRAFLRDEEEADAQAAAHDEDEAEELEDEAAAFDDDEPDFEADDVTAEAEEEFDEDDDSLMAEPDTDEIVFADEAEDLDAEEDELDTNDSVAAKLQRIRAVVTPPAPAAASDDDAEEDADDAPAPMGKGMNPLAMRLAELARRNNEEDAAESAAEEAEDDDDMSDAAYAEDDGYETEDYDAVAEADAEDEVAEFEEDTTEEDEPEESDALMLGEADVPDEDEGELAAQTDDAEDMADPLDEEDDESEQHVSAIEAAIARRRENSSKRADLPGNVDETMNRMMSQADAHLNEPEGRRHRDAFAQLKAAVAATEAARQLGDAGAQARDPGEAFREDLDAHEAEEADVVSRDISDEVAASPSPLRLVPAQRVSEDEDAAKSADPAPAGGATERLRRIASERESVGEKTGGFAEFAAQKGATELGDLLEAAAAYIAFVEGDDDFSRPQVMKKVQMASADEFSREDGLRSFGRLLRQSKIIKLNNGRFQVSGNTRFRPDDKAAQG